MSTTDDVVTASPRGRRKVREGIVVSDKMDRTRIVLVQEQKPHALYKKVVRINRRLKVDDATNEAHVGDRVRIAETRPLSKDKRWRLDAVLEKAK